MKDYKQVIAERYDGERGYDGAKIPGDSLYALHRPIGRYGLYNFSKVLSNLIHFCLSHGMEKVFCSGHLQVLDIGCGNGKDTVLLREFLMPFNAQIYGMDFARRSIEECKKRIPGIDCRYGDVVEKIPFDQKFHIITAFVVLMHLSKEEDIVRALKNICNSLEDDGLFLWYEGYAKNHFVSDEQAESTGYSLRQMDELAYRAGMKRVFYDSFYRVVPKYGNTVYFAKKFSIPFLELCSHMFWFLPPGNYMCIYQKNKTDVDA